STRLVAGAAALVAAGCAATAPTVERHQRVVSAGHAIDVRIVLQAEHARDADRFARAATSALNACAAWSAAYAQPALTLIDPAWRSTTSGGSDVVVLDRTPWWTARTSMAPELASARAVGRRCLADALLPRALPSWFVA